MPHFLFSFRLRLARTTYPLCFPYWSGALFARSVAFHLIDEWSCQRLAKGSARIRRPLQAVWAEPTKIQSRVYTSSLEEKVPRSRRVECGGNRLAPGHHRYHREAPLTQAQVPTMSTPPSRWYCGNTIKQRKTSVLSSLMYRPNHHIILLDLIAHSQTQNWNHRHIRTRYTFALSITDVYMADSRDLVFAMRMQRFKGKVWIKMTKYRGPCWQQVRKQERIFERTDEVRSSFVRWVPRAENGRVIDSWP